MAGGTLSTDAHGQWSVLSLAKIFGEFIYTLKTEEVDHRITSEGPTTEGVAPTPFARIRAHVSRIVPERTNDLGKLGVHSCHRRLHLRHP
jgi:hypothetical protein